MRHTAEQPAKLNKKGLRTFIAGIALGGAVAAPATAVAMHFAESSSATDSATVQRLEKEHSEDQLKDFYSQPELANALKTNCAVSGEKTAIYIVREGDTPITIGQTLANKGSIEDVTDEVMKQTSFADDGNLNLGEEVAFPISQLNADTFKPYHPEAAGYHSSVDVNGHEFIVQSTVEPQTELVYIEPLPQ